MDFEEDLNVEYPENNSPGKEEEFLFGDEAPEDLDPELLGNESDGGPNNEDENEEDGDGEGEDEDEEDEAEGASEDGSDENDAESDDDEEDDEDDDAMDVDRSPKKPKPTTEPTPKPIKEAGSRTSSPILETNGDGSIPTSTASSIGITQTGHSVPRRSPSPPPAFKRQRLFYPSLTLPTLKTLHIDPIATIPIHSAVHSLSSSLCFSHLLTGSEDGFIRDWDPWETANGKSVMTAQQRAVAGLGESVTKGGVARGWWANDGGKLRQGGENAGWKDEGSILGGKNAEGKKREPVYSMACQKDALWGLSGTANGNINLFTIRHAMGQIHHVLQNGHKDAISALALNDTDDILYSASWDGSVAEWDLNTGRKIRSFPTQGVQLSSLSLQPLQGGPNNIHHRDITISYNTFARQLEDSESIPLTQKSIAPPNSSQSAHPTTNGTSKPPASTKPPSAPTKSLSKAPLSKLSNLNANEEQDAQGEIDEDLFGDNALTEPTRPSTIAPASKPIRKPSLLSLPAHHPTTNGSSLPDANGISTDSSQFSPSNIPTFIASTSANAPPPVSRYIPSLSPATYSTFSNDILMTSSIDGNVTLWDRRVPPQEMGSRGVGRLEGGEKTPKWCMSACFSATGSQVYAGRRNGTVEVWDIRRTASSSSSASLSSSHVLKTLKNPNDSGAVSCVVAFPDGGHIACASNDNVRLWPTAHLFDDFPTYRPSGVPFKIVPGHHGGIISSMIVDPTSTFLVTASGNRGWVGQGESTSVVVLHSIKKTYG